MHPFPPQPKKRPKPKQILPEEEYVRRVQLIIQRDFFPTPLTPPTADPRLDVFLARYTTQDNNAFNEVMARQLADFHKTHDWHFSPAFRRLCAPSDSFLFPALPPARSPPPSKAEIVYKNTALLVEAELAAEAARPASPPPEFLFTLDDSDYLVRRRPRRPRFAP